MDKKIFFLLSVAAVALSLSGCFAGVETRSGWHMVSLPPSSGKRLAAQCSVASALRGPNSNTLSLIEERHKMQDKTFRDIIRDLQMENAALRAANNHLLGKD